jgi:hypothetical protein
MFIKRINCGFASVSVFGWNPANLAPHTFHEAQGEVDDRWVYLDALRPLVPVCGSYSVAHLNPQ